MKNYIWTIKDHFGKEYTIQSRFENPEAVREYIEGLGISEVVETAIRAYCPGNIGVAQLSLETGKVGGALFSQGSGDIETHYIDLMTVKDNNWDMETEDWINGEEIDAYKALLENEYLTVIEFMERVGIDAEERLLEMYLYGEYTIDIDELLFPEVVSIIEEVE